MGYGVTLLETVFGYFIALLETALGISCTLLKWLEKCNWDLVGFVGAAIVMSSSLIGNCNCDAK